MSKRDLTILGCASQQHTRTRNHGAYLVRWNGSGFLFDPGEGTQRQLIFAEIAPTCINYIFISHFHGDHCLGLGSMLLRLNLDNVTHQIHCFYPASGKKYFDALRYSSIYHERIHVVEHPISKEGVVFQNEEFTVEAYALLHGVDNFGWRVTEASTRKYDPEKLRAKGVFGMDIKALAQNGTVTTPAGTVVLDDVSTIRQGDTFAVAIDTLPTPNIEKIAKGSRLFLCEATYLDKDRDIAKSHNHLTAKQAAEAAKKAGAQELVLTHFSARYLDLRPFMEEASSIFPNVHVAEDLKVIDFPKNPPKETE